MEDAQGGQPLDQSSILKTLLQRVEAITSASDWDRELPEDIVPDTYFVTHLGFSSMDLVMLVIDMQECFQRYDLPFDELFAPDGEYVKDLRVVDMGNFLCKHLGA
jgi:hypothetical protein